jgi:glycerol-3-phosphate acyltransferase PlsY
MDAAVAAFSSLVGYLLGSLSFARIVTRIAAPEQDISRLEVELPSGEASFESDAISATTVRLHVGRGYGCLVSILDMLKAALPAIAFRITWPDESYYLIAAGAATVGHIWPIYHRFRGGRGLSPILGGMLVVDWFGVVITNLVGAVAGTLLNNNLVVLTGTGIVLMIPWAWIRYRDPAQVIYLVAMNILYWTVMIPEWREYVRLWREGNLGNFQEAEQLRIVRKRGDNVVDWVTLPILLSKISARFRGG